MVSNVGTEDLDFILRFGGGVHSRASEDEIDPRECKEGQNFELDVQNSEYRNRKPIDKIGTVPNTSRINGLITHRKRDGTVTWLVQAGGIVYEWDGAATFTQRATVSSSARLRGTLGSQWELDDKVIITDLALADVVMQWDGTDLTDITFTKNNGGGAFGPFRAKYCTVSKERAMYASVHSSSTFTEHLFVGSLRGDFADISTDNRPSSALSEADPFFLIQPDYKAINGTVQAFDVVTTSSEFGSLFRLTGESAKDFAFLEFYPRSGAEGRESVAYVGNDIFYGRQGRIESVLSTAKFGDVETDDLSIDISDSIDGFKDWTIVYNSRNQRVYCLPGSQNEMWVFHKPIFERFKQVEQGVDQSTSQGLGLSPWVKWTTQNTVNMSFTAMMNMLDPLDGLEYVFAGDANGNIYRIEGSGSGDAGATDVKTERLSSLIQMPLDAEAYGVEGYIQYRKSEEATVALSFEFSGMSVFNEVINITLPTSTINTAYNRDEYYSNGEHYGDAFSGRLTRQKLKVPGKGNAFLVRVTVDGKNDFEINSIGLRFSAGS